MSRRLLLRASLALNFALVCVGVWLVQRPAPGGSAAPLRNIRTNRPVRGGAVAVSTSALPAVISAPAAFDWSQVASTNLAQYATNLLAIECPREIIGQIILTVVNEDFARRRHAIFAPIHAQFWELMVQPEYFKGNAEYDDTGHRSNELRAERSEQLKAVLGADWQRGAEPSRLPVYYYQPTLNFLPEEKQRQWSQLDEDFNQRQQDIYQKMRGNDAEQKAQLEATMKEHEEARRKLLTDGEFQEYTARTASQSGWAQNLPGFEASEAEYRALNQLRVTSPANQASQVNAQAKAFLGEERFVAFQRGQDQRFAELLALAGRCQIPAPTAELIYQQRVSAEQQCALLRSNPALSAEDRRPLLLAIQSETRQQVLGTLGQTAGEAYLRLHGNWLEALANQP